MHALEAGEAQHEHGAVRAMLPARAAALTLLVVLLCYSTPCAALAIAATYSSSGTVYHQQLRMQHAPSGCSRSPCATPQPGVLRRTLLQSLVAGIALSAFVDVVTAEEAAPAGDSASTTPWATYRDQEVGFSLSYPSGWTTSRRRGNPNAFTLGPKSVTGTVLVAGDYVAGLAVSVTISNVRQLLEAAGFDSGGRLESIANVGKPKGVADLLLRQRDGVLQEKSPLSRVSSASAQGTQLDFVCETITTLAVTGSAPKASELAPLEPKIRSTFARSYLRGNGEMVTVWASGADESLLRGIVSTFQLAA